MENQSQKNYWATPGPHEPKSKSVIVDSERKNTKVLPINYGVMKKLGADNKKAAHPHDAFPARSFGYKK